MIPLVGPDPELSDLERMSVLLLLHPTGQDADDGVPIRVPLKEDLIQDSGEEITRESGLQPFLIPLRPFGSALAGPIHGEAPLMSISLAWNQDENPHPSLSEKFVIEIGFRWPANARNTNDSATSGLLVIPLPSPNKRRRYLFSGHHNLNVCQSGYRESPSVKGCRRARWQARRTPASRIALDQQTLARTQEQKQEIGDIPAEDVNGLQNDHVDSQSSDEAE
jgi:hypothetical protein